MATMTRKEFVLQVTEALQKNPRAVLAGHGIPANVLKLIASRPDVIAKLAVILWSTKYFKKGAKGLKKALNFKISGYKNFQDFNKRARQDVETFMGSLAPVDQSTFNNNDNILAIIMLPDSASGEEDVDITFGKSVPVGFDKAVRKEFKIPGGIYITIMWGDSAIRPVEEKKAAVKSKINARKQAKRTPAKIKMELTRKAKTKLEKLSIENDKLQGKRRKNTLEMEQIKDFANYLGVNGKDERSIIGGIKGYSGEMKNLVSKLSRPKKALFKKAITLTRAGNSKEAEKLLNNIGNKRITDLVLNRGGQTQISKVQGARISAMKKEIKMLSRSNEKLLVDMSLAPTASLKSSIRQKMKRQIARINELKVKLKVYDKSFTISGLKNKSKMISDTNKRIEANLAKGQSINIALSNAIASLNASDSEKQEIKDVVINEVAEGTPMQFAIQSAIQQKVQQAPQQRAQQIAQQVIQQVPEDYGNEDYANEDYGNEDYANEDYANDSMSINYSSDDEFIVEIVNRVAEYNDETSSAIESSINDVCNEFEVNPYEIIVDGIPLINYITNELIGEQSYNTSEEDLTLNSNGMPVSGYQRDNLDVAGNAYNDYTIYNDPEDRPSESEIMSYFTDACTEAGIDASEMTAAYDVYHDNVEKYMSTANGAPSSQDFGNEYDTTLVGNSTIDDILSML